MLVLLLAGPALALPCVSAGKAAAQGAPQVSVALQGSIEKSCALSAATTQLNLGDLEAGSSASLALEVSCNAPFTYSLGSLNGGLQHQGAGPVAGFIDLLPYEAAFTLPLDDGSRIDDRCASTAIGPGGAGCAFTGSGDAIALNQSATLGVSWSPPALPLLAGVYSDELTLSVAVVP